MTMTVDTTLKHWGNCAGVRITKESMAAAQIDISEPIEITVTDGQIVIKKQRRKSLAELFAHYDGYYDPTAEDTDWLAMAPAGEEWR
ncbi:AbrB/MazE/SpoVT family DNA-binding domain-containing protein [Lacticaseibacillus absianus]|uniref:AbrB/MazE/SpoVT family DNA-binding domain-containing protein n=1 Tax=Lacticaseibacillus absianus TaxID=2729623 RepID=UPI0015C77D5A|nr:hypothetical protein [Lacticaseibacillus absianus]